MRRLTQRSVRGRFLIAFAAILVPLFGGWAGSGLVLHHTVGGFRDVSAEARAESRAAAELRGRVLESESMLEEVLESPPDAGRRDAFRAEADAVEESLRSLGADGETERRMLARALDAWAQARLSADAALAVHARTAAGGEPEAFYDHLDATADAVERFDAAVDLELAAEIDDAARVERLQIALAVAAALVVAALALAVARWLAGSILRPLTELRRAADSLRLDALDARVAAGRADEFGDVAEAFNHMSERLARHRDELEFRAFHDPLTGLANRALLADRVEHARARAARTGAPLAVLMLDLDDFKHVNDTLGHAAGDELLNEVAARLRAAVRAQDTVARLGGDEFAVLLEELQEPAEAMWVADRILGALQRPYELGESGIAGTVSIGMAVSVAAAESADDLLRDADLAMYRAKDAGKNRIETFRPQMYTAAVERKALEADLRQAVGSGELFLQYQPLVNLDGGRVYGFEALVRWRHPLRGVVPPNTFVPVAEETGLINPIGAWVLDRACADAAAWPALDGEPLTLSVNVSARQLVDARIVGVVARALASSDLDPARLVLEITESALVRDGEAVAPQLTALKALGVSLAVDDFGTGYSSLGRLRSLPVDVIKIDKSFVDGVASADAAFVSAIVRLADDIELVAVAEGVEHAEQCDALRRLGCTRGQGYFFARPLDAGAVAGFVAEAAPARGA